MAQAEVDRLLREIKEQRLLILQHKGTIQWCQNELAKLAMNDPAMSWLTDENDRDQARTEFNNEILRLRGLINARHESIRVLKLQLEPYLPML